MSTRKLNAAIISILCATGTIVAAEEVKTIRMSSVEVQNVVSQHMAAARSGDAGALNKARRELYAQSGRDNVNIVREITPEEVFVFKLELLKIAESLIDPTFNLDEFRKAGADGVVPRPPVEERPEKFRDRYLPLWMPRQDPEDFKESDPELYAFYKPLYEENLRNTKRRDQQMGARGTREALIREVRMYLGMSYSSAQYRNTNPQYVQRREVVNKLIQDKQLLKELFAEEPSK